MPPAGPYEYPDILSTESEAERFYHLDLPHLSDDDLDTEAEDLKEAIRDDCRAKGPTPWMLTLDGFPVSRRDWAHERASRVAAEQKRRAAR